MKVILHLIFNTKNKVLLIFKHRNNKFHCLHFYCFMYNCVLVSKLFKMEVESFKEYLEAATVEKKQSLNDEILLRGTSYVFINAGRYSFFFGSRNQGSGALKNFQAAEGFYGKRNYIFRWEFMLISVHLWLTFPLCSR